MKKFVRKTSELNFPRQRRSHTQRSESSQGQLNHSQTIIRNLTIHDLSIQKTQNNSKSSSCLIFTLLKSKLSQNMKYGMDRIKWKLKQEDKKNKCVLRVFSIDNKIQWLNKRQALSYIKSYSKKYELRIKGLSILKNIFSIVNKKNKLYTIFKFTQLIKSHIKQQNVVLKNIELKYNQNYIPENFMKQYRKFVKINSKNTKILLRNTQEVLQPSLDNLSIQLQARRIKKTLQSDTQIIVNLIKNYIQSFKQSSLKLQACQSQKKQVENQRYQLSNQINKMAKEIQNKLKQFKKYDFDLTQKCEILTDNGYTLHNLRLLDRVIHQQIRMWQGKESYGYEYTSRIVLLKTSAIVLKKLLQNVQKQQKRKSDGSPKKSPMNNTYIGGIKKKVSIIEELNSIDQSDIIEQIRKIIDQLIQKMKSQVLPQNLEQINKISKLHCKKNSSNSQLISIYEKLEQILKIFFNKLLASQKILSESQKSIKNELRNQQLIQNLQYENKYLHEEITKKISKIILQEQKIQFQKSVIKQLNAKLQTVQNQLVFCHKQLSQKTKQLQQANQKHLRSDKKIDQVDKQYKRFKKMMKESIDKHSSRDNSISNIMNKSLFHSGKKQKNKTMIRNQSQTIIHANRGFLDNSSILNGQINVNYTMSVDEYFNQDNQNKKISSAKILKKEKNLEIMKNQLSDFMNESFYDEKPESNQTIVQLSSKLIQSQKLLNQYSDQMFKIDKKQASSYPKHLYLLPENISTLLYHIMLRVKRVPQNSELNTSLWNQLSSICQQSNGVQLLAGLEEYTVEWLIEKVVQPINNRLKKLDKSLVIIDEWNSLPKTPRKSPLKNTVQYPLTKTIKNNDILESQILEK